MADVMLLGAVIFVVGALCGRFWPARRRTPKPVPPPRPFCGCGHHHGFHDPKTGECHGLMNGNPLQYDSWDAPTAYEQIPCTCRQYSGPVPLPEYVAQELSQ
jgi:hypothetical protein